MNRICAIFVKVFLISALFVGIQLALADEPPVDEFPVADEGLQMPGSIEGTGKHFEITDSEYLNIILDSTEEICLTLESVPEMVSMFIESTSSATSTVITLSGFSPSTTYYKYEDNYHNLEVLTTDGDGSYSYVQDISTPHFVFIQPRKSTRYIPSDPDIGTWDPVTSTYTLTTDVYETIQIDEDDLTLDGAEYTITGTGTGSGVYLYGRTGVTVKNLNVQNFSYGIKLELSSNNTLTGNTASNNYRGISLYSSSNNTLTGNTAISNRSNGIRIDSSSNNTLTGNTASNSYSGISLYSSSSNTLTGNTALGNMWSGIVLSGSGNNTLTGNIASNNSTGITLGSSSNSNTLTSNTASYNKSGIYLQRSSGNTLTGNTMLGNTSLNFQVSGSTESDFNNNIDTSNTVDGKPVYYVKNAVDQVYDSSTDAGVFYAINCDNITIKDLNLTKNYDGVVLWQTHNSRIENVNASYNVSGTGIYLLYSNSNTLTGNTASYNLYGIRLYYSSNNTLTGNTASDNLHGIYLNSSNSNTLTGNTASDNYYYIKGYGIRLYSSNSNTLTGNTASNNNDGISLWSSSGNTLSGNTASEGYNSGIYIGGISNDNQIYNNNFIGNTTQALVYGGSGNVFNLDKPIGGNYWSDWTSPDDDGDGFVDFPYDFIGGQDNLPWTIQDGWPENYPPVADAGPDQTVLLGESVNFDGIGSSDIDGTIDSYQWDFGDETPSESGVGVNHDYASEGTYTVTLTVTDDDGDIGTDTATVTIFNLTSEHGTQMTFSEGEKWFTDWSPDGEWITYSQQGPGGKYDIWIISAAGGEPSNLTHTIDGNCIFPNFTADSCEVTFTNNWEIKSINISTMNVRVIRTNATNGFWSHNGRYLVYRRGDTAKLMVYDSVNNVDFVIAPGDPRGEDWFWYAVPAFSGDDSHVITSVIDEADDSHKLNTIPSTGGQYEQVTDFPGYHWYPDYSYNSEWILYSNFIYGFDLVPGGHSAYAVLWVYNVLTGEEVQVFPGTPVKNYCSSFSPDGDKFSYIINNQIYVTDFPFFEPQITVISPNGGETLITGSEFPIQWESSGVETLTIEYRSNGEWNSIKEGVDASGGIFNWTIPSGNSSDCYIKITDVSNPNVFDQNDEPFTMFELTSEFGTQMTFDGGRKWYTDWSSDGKWITYSRRISQNPWNVYLFSMESNETHNLTSQIGNDCIFPNFTPDSQEVTYSNHYPVPEDNSGWYLESVTIDTNQSRVITDQGTNGFWSNSGRYFAYSSYSQTPLILFDVINNTETDLAEENYNWAVTTFGPDDSYVITGLNEGEYLENERLYKIPLDGSQSEQLTFHDGSHWYPDCSPDGEWILYTNFTDTSNNAALEPEIWVYNSLSKESTQVFPGCPLENWSANFSPDGSEFCYLLRFDYGYELFITDFPFESQVITAIANIIEKIETLEDAGEIKKGIANSLIKKLEGAISKLEQGNTTAATNKLRAFINHLQAIRGKKIDEEDADEMIAAAEAIISVISSGGGVAKPALSQKEAAEETTVPLTYSLSQNSPNPFNPTTTISFSLAEAGNVTVVVFNLAGQKVDTIANEFMDAGSHSVVWDATDYTGHKVSSGIYIYQLQAGEFTKSNKMILMR